MKTSAQSANVVAIAVDAAAKMTVFDLSLAIARNGNSTSFHDR
jgi:hypothetical protein